MDAASGKPTATSDSTAKANQRLPEWQELPEGKRRELVVTLAALLIKQLPHRLRRQPAGEVGDE